MRLTGAGRWLYLLSIDGTSVSDEISRKELPMRELKNHYPLGNEIDAGDLRRLGRRFATVSPSSLGQDGLLSTRW